ncbi:hypothetical protein GGR57DRAFT_230022 [Xylariaceae sp. FL1272]|nr:hypothetical protein GGR57DRAFT_230022 [Xylariaceae sp. FL1272]
MSVWDKSIVVIALLFGGFTGTVDAQGYFFEPFTCSTTQNFQELGCYDVSNDPFSYAVQNGFIGSDASRSYANYNGGGNNINSTATPNYCVAACRAHGFKYASLYNRNCRCGSALGSLNNARSSDQTCKTVPDPNPCSGDALENCGQPNGGGRARLYVDPSFEPETSLIAAGFSNVASSAGYLGCFAKPNLPSDDPASNTQQANPAACLANCAQYGFPLTYMFRDGGNIRCYCGTDFGVGSRSYDDSVNDANPNDKKCAVDCSTGSRTCDPTTGTTTCCGDPNFQIYPVYANPRLIGCEIPRIPGFAPIEQNGGPATPVSTEYTCIATPASLSSHRNLFTQYSTGGVANPTVTRSASFVATATVTSDAVTSSMINYGCYDINDLRVLSSTGAIATAAPSGTPENIDVDKCANYYYAMGSPWAAVSGPRTGTRCICGDSVLSGLNPIAMDYCNEPCLGTGSEQNCAGQNRALIYAVATSATTGPWYTSYTNSITTRTLHRWYVMRFLSCDIKASRVSSKEDVFQRLQAW